MNKIERVRLALAGEDVDRPPFGFWYHFGLQHMPGSKHAEAEIDFFRAYDLDFLKAQCTRMLWLDRGRLVMDGCPVRVAAEYRERRGVFGD